MKKLIIIPILLLQILSSCNKKDSDESTTKKDLELKEKELELKERELALKEKELENKSSSPVAGEIKGSGTIGDYPEVSLTKLTTADLENKTDWELRLMRNEVYARHGYIFKLPELRDYFLIQSWYVPQSEDVNDLLTPLEKENIEQIKRYESYVGSQYNKYSR
ncbi:MAG: YARHG domain-containing protein [Ignavibacteria bacterium]